MDGREYLRQSCKLYSALQDLEALIYTFVSVFDRSRPHGRYVRASIGREICDKRLADLCSPVKSLLE